MNQTSKCHLIQGCNGLYIDAFRAFKSKIYDARATFILTHYHADHYSGLPRGKAYNGPALIHCTPITAALLKEMHGIDPDFIVAHPYGQTWELGTNKENIRITFYDANHCPGAAIIHVHNVHQDKHYIHTGDMRFHKRKFSRYSLITNAIRQRKIDLLYLDTTYSKPKHDFIPQDEAIQMIASNVKALLKDNHDIVAAKKKNFFQPKSTTSLNKDNMNSSSRNSTSSQRTLVLLSCYSIGKEKVLWHSAIQSNQKVYVDKRKYKMLHCIQCDQNKDNNGVPATAATSVSESTIDESCNIYSKCTTNPQESDIHVIQMGLAGSLHPFFKPNYEQVALYAHQLNKGYSKVVAFIPTGWAISSKFNKENSISSKSILLQDLKDLLPEKTARKGCYGNDSEILVEIRLVAYSEHSSYSELRSCVEFFKPRQIIPTVFSNEKDYNAIESRFRDLIDSHRAKADFIKMIGGGQSSSASSSSSKRTTNPPTNCKSSVNIPYLHNSSKKSNNTCSSSSEISENNPYKTTSRYSSNKTCSTTCTPNDKKRKKAMVSSSGYNDTTRTPSNKKKDERMKAEDADSMNKTPRKGGFTLNKKMEGPPRKKRPQPFRLDEEKLAILQGMGFDTDSAQQSLKAKRNNMEQALDLLLNEK